MDYICSKTNPGSGHPSCMSYVCPATSRIPKLCEFHIDINTTVSPRINVHALVSENDMF